MALKIIGAGVGRTGTLSLKLALEHLGVGRCYHMAEVLADGRKNLPLWLNAVRGMPDWAAIFAGYTASVDYPGCTYWRELAAIYPDAKIILSTRDPDSWFDSVSKTIFAPDHVRGFSGGPMGEFMHGAVVGMFGERISDRSFMTDWFAQWQSYVIASLPPERLLVFQARDGWEPLCAFLGVPVPAEPYPRVNSSEEMTTSNRPSEPPPLEMIEQFARDYLAQCKAKAFGAS